LTSNSKGQFDVIIRSINSRDARTATVTNLPWEFLNKLAQEILGIDKTKHIYYDVTPKPPATIEYV
ncbi:MAG: GMP synthase (glutamine-hydrolyzing), partial [Promethearchaeota archaeon]